MLKARDINFSYGEDIVLKDISLEMAPGEITVVIGPSGAGKTTLLRALTCVDCPQSGSLEIDDQFSYSFPVASDALPPAPWPYITVSFQQQFLWPHMTLRQNILLPLAERNEEPHMGFDELVELFDMQHFIDRYPNEASLGQRQRAAMARAVILNPRYLFLDEITTFLDVVQIAKILECIKKLKERGISVFIITHLIEFAKEVADQVLFFDKGVILEKGDSKILDKPKTKELKSFLAAAMIAR